MHQVLLVLDPSSSAELGLDLDDVTSTEADSGPCPHDDLTDAAGQPGIDNELARLGPIIERLGVGDVAGYVQQNVTDANLVILVEITGLDSFEDDPSVDIRLVRGSGPNDLGTDGLGVPFQSFDVLADAEPLVGRGRVVDGELLATLEGELRLPFYLLQSEGEARLSRIRMRARLDPDAHMTGGVAEGVAGGVVEVADLLEVVARSEGEIDPAPLRLIQRTLSGAADFDPTPDGTQCTGLSLGFRLRAVPAFLLPVE